MKNITVSVDEAVHRRARLRAAELNTSLSSLVKGFLEDLAADETEAARHKRLQNALLDRLDAQGRGIRGGDRLDRAELHARP
jgi:anti-sigma factor ChrR (cupin superfamily)